MKPFGTFVALVALPLFLASGGGGSLSAQWPALGGHIDYSGDWTPIQNQDNAENPLVGDWMGIPLSEAGFARAEAWDASVQSLPEWQCRPHGWAYMFRSPPLLRIRRDSEPVSREPIAFHAHWLVSSETPIYVDGRKHPPVYAPHTWMGFSTGTWEGHILKITTTHLKEGYYRRNGIPASDQATITTYWIRRDEILTWISIAYDPVYLTEPLIRSGEYRLSIDAPFPSHPCTPADEGRPKGEVPAHFPGENPFLEEAATKMKIPDDALRAGAASMYPEFRTRLRSR
jgi:hypothetical protein